MVLILRQNLEFFCIPFDYHKNSLYIVLYGLNFASKSGVFCIPFDYHKNSLYNVYGLNSASKPGVFCIPFNYHKSFLYMVLTLRQNLEFFAYLSTTIKILGIGS